MNLLIIVGDDIGLEQYELDGQGSDYPAMPNTKALADNGVRFTQFRVIPSCSGTRACLYTGRFSDRNGIGEAVEVVGGGGEVPELKRSEITFADFLKLAGSPHKSALIGKDHVFTGGRSIGELDQPRKFGFDYWNGQIRNITSSDDAQGYSNWEKRTQYGTFFTKTYNTTDSTDEAIGWIKEQDAAGNPWVCFLCYQAIHNPISETKSPVPTSLYTSGTWGTPPADAWNNMKASLEALDVEMGRVLAAIDYAETTVLYISDNGQEPGRLVNETHPTKGVYPAGYGKRTFYEGGIRSPLYVRGAGVTSPGRTNDDPWFVTDLYQTMGELLGYDPAGWLSDTAYPRRPKRVLDSISFKHVLDNVAGTPRTSSVLGLFSPNEVNALDAPGQRCVVLKQGSSIYKLVVIPSFQEQSSRLFWNLTALDAANQFETSGNDLLLGGGNPSVLGATDRAAYDACQQAMADLAASITANDLKFASQTSEYPT